ncbi:MAG: SgcJ/EcaC family oxidoreductase, partial [Planctomycetes bacterium]|nr:SgcJ/EcaC family oxidoreductase [Planctomycetota bacterium]
MKRMLLAVFWIVASCASGGVERASKPSVEIATDPLPPDRDRVLRDYERAWRAHDAAALAALFAEDGFVMADSSAPARGREAIRKAYAGAGGLLDLRAFPHAVDGNVAWILGTFRHGPTAPDAGKFTFVLRRESGGPWLIAVDMDARLDAAARAGVISSLRVWRLTMRGIRLLVCGAVGFLLVATVVRHALASNSSTGSA